jgi:predicted nucleic acid-binding protein
MMPAIVCNTGPIIALSAIRKLNILKNLYETVYLPSAVYNEIVTGEEHLREFYQFRDIDWFNILELQQPMDPLLSTVLDIGEASVIQLSREIGVMKILMDERKGRKVAREIYGLTVIGTARILVDAKKANLISSVKDLMYEMMDNGYWIHDNIIQAALKEVNEKD